MENKKYSKNYYQANKEKLQKRSREYYRNLSETYKIFKNRNYAKNENKNMTDKDKERKENT